ncbi:molybdopterin-dependent oxidoreductase, partial [Streptomyces sp. MBT57]|nr:molybdopterin-dependent oxidoreductase [Streptomyces sp. MBT57]
ANLRLSDFTAPTTLLATHRGGEPLTAEHGSPPRWVASRVVGAVKSDNRRLAL